MYSHNSKIKTTASFIIGGLQDLTQASKRNDNDVISIADAGIASTKLNLIELQEE